MDRGDSGADEHQSSQPPSRGRSPGRATPTRETGSKQHATFSFSVRRHPVVTGCQLFHLPSLPPCLHCHQLAAARLNVWVGQRCWHGSLRPSLSQRRDRMLRRAESVIPGAQPDGACQGAARGVGIHPHGLALRGAGTLRSRQVLALRCAAGRSGDENGASLRLHDHQTTPLHYLLAPPRRHNGAHERTLPLSMRTPPRKQHHMHHASMYNNVTGNAVHVSSATLRV